MDGHAADGCSLQLASYSRKQGRLCWQNWRRRVDIATVLLVWNNQLAFANFCHASCMLPLQFCKLPDGTWSITRSLVPTFPTPLHSHSFYAYYQAAKHTQPTHFYNSLPAACQHLPHLPPPTSSPQPNKLAWMYPVVAGHHHSHASACAPPSLQAPFHLPSTYCANKGCPCSRSSRR